MSTFKRFGMSLALLAFTAPLLSTAHAEDRAVVEFVVVLVKKQGADVVLPAE